MIHLNTLLLILVVVLGIIGVLMRTASLNSVNRRLDTMSKKFDDEITRLNQSVADMTTVEDSTIALLDNLSNQVRANMNDPVALDSLATAIDIQRDRLAAAVAANTIADPAATPPSSDPPADPPAASEGTV